MSKILVQRTITVTLEMTGDEAQGLMDLLDGGVTSDTRIELNLDKVYKSLGEEFKTVRVKFTQKANKSA